MTIVIGPVELLTLVVVPLAFKLVFMVARAVERWYDQRE